MKGCVVRCLANVTRIDDTHGVILVALFIMLDSMLHGQTTIKHNVNHHERGIWQDISNSNKSEGREFAQ